MSQRKVKLTDIEEFESRFQADLGFTPEDSSNKGIASGYAPLDVNSKVPLENLCPINVVHDSTLTGSGTTLSPLTVTEYSVNRIDITGGTQTVTLLKNKNIFDHLLTSGNILNIYFDTPETGRTNSYTLDFMVGNTQPTINFYSTPYSSIGTIFVNTGGGVTGESTTFLSDYRVGHSLISGTGSTITKIVASIGSDTIMNIVGTYTTTQVTEINTTNAGFYKHGSIWWQNVVVPVFTQNTKYQIIFDYVEETPNNFKLKAVIGAF